MSGTHEFIPDERNQNILVYVNGELFPRDEAKVSVFDSAFLVGDGFWEAFVCTTANWRSYKSISHAYKPTAKCWIMR